MKTSYLFILSAIFLFSSISCKQKSKASTEVAVADWEVVEQEINLPEDEPEVSEEDTTIYKSAVTTAALKDAIPYFRRHNRLKDWDPAKTKEIMVRAVIEKDGSPTRIRVAAYSEMDPSTKEMKRLEHWKEDDFTREAIRLIEAAEIAPASNEQGTALRTDWAIMVCFPPH